MKIPIKQIIIQEGLLDFLRNNKGKLSAAAGATAGAFGYRDYMNSGAKGIGDYLGQKGSAIGSTAKNMWDKTTDATKSGYDGIKKSLESFSDKGNIQPQNPNYSSAPKADTISDKFYNEKLAHDEIMKQGTGQQTIRDTLDPEKLNKFNSLINSTFNNDSTEI